MIVSELFTQVNGSFRGSDDDAPTTGTDFDLWLATANRKMYEWARDGKNTWESLFAINQIGTVSVGTQNYDLDDEILIPSDQLYVTTTANTYYYTICKPQERLRFNTSAYISGHNPQTVTFTNTFITGSPVVGGTINVPGYYLPDQLTSASDTIPVDDPYWLVLAVASELAFNDITYSDKAPDLNAKADNLYTQMVSNNRRGSSNNPRTAQTNVSRILSPSSESGVGTI